jgi:transposase
MRELSVAEQRYQAVMAVVGDGLSVSQVAEKVGVSRQTVHTWLARYEAEVLADGAPLLAEVVWVTPGERWLDDGMAPNGALGGRSPAAAEESARGQLAHTSTAHRWHCC